MPDLIGVFKAVWCFLLAWQLLAFLCHILKFCKCKRWRWSQSLCLSIQFITWLMLSNTLLVLGMQTHVFILTVIFQYFQLSTPIPMLEGFSVAQVERNQWLLSKSLFMCKVILPIQSDQLDSRHLNKVVYKKKINAVKFAAELFIAKINGIMLGDMTRPIV
jgi:hypothetical protein